MLVTMGIGRYAGEVRDVAPHVARNLIKQGRATDIRMEGAARPKQGKRKRRRPVTTTA